MCLINSVVLADGKCEQENFGMRHFYSGACDTHTCFMSTSGTSTGVADRNLPMTAMVGPSMSGVKPYCRKEHCKFVGEEFKTTTATSQNALSSDEDYELHVDVSGEAVRIGKENVLVSQMIHKMSTVILLRKGKNACLVNCSIKQAW